MEVFNQHEEHVLKMQHKKPSKRECPSTEENRLKLWKRNQAKVFCGAGLMSCMRTSNTGVALCVVKSKDVE